MPYTVTLTRGAVFANIADGTINQTSTMTLIGRDFANYGQFVDQDLVRLLDRALPHKTEAQPAHSLDNFGLI